ncbi:hypothetical protein CEXT_45811 [Caerostris extrusa]|uniref:Uncharacterized protein n=1 Tax=Caerostris extrusa TaxID=172846 RepID=A0AAV4XE75_CAEEX|nr:hypothetical protein CEXT_45811 [Caerostris extrusa]
MELGQYVKLRLHRRKQMQNSRQGHRQKTGCRKLLPSVYSLFHPGVIGIDSQPPDSGYLLWEPRMFHTNSIDEEFVVLEGQE